MTARLLRAGQAKMSKKLAEEAIEVVIDAMNGQADAVVRESADLIYNLAVLWVSCGVKPRDVWAEMDRRATGGSVLHASGAGGGPTSGGLNYSSPKAVC